jgi:hypothetical protein
VYWGKLGDETTQAACQKNDLTYFDKYSYQIAYSFIPDKGWDVIARLCTPLGTPQLTPVSDDGHVVSLLAAYTSPGGNGNPIGYIVPLTSNLIQCDGKKPIRPGGTPFKCQRTNKKSAMATLYSSDFGSSNTVELGGEQFIRFAYLETALTPDNKFQCMEGGKKVGVPSVCDIPPYGGTICSDPELMVNYCQATYGDGEILSPEGAKKVVSTWTANFVEGNKYECKENESPRGNLLTCPEGLKACNNENTRIAICHKQYFIEPRVDDIIFE